MASVKKEDVEERLAPLKKEIMASVKKEQVEEEHRVEAKPKKSGRMITRSAFKRKLEEPSSDVNNNQQQQQQQQQQPRGKKQKKLKSLKKNDHMKNKSKLNTIRDDRKQPKALAHFPKYRPFTYEERRAYNSRLEVTGGFDVGDLPDNINPRDMPIRPYHVLDKLLDPAPIKRLKMVEHYSKLAIKKYNKDHETEYQFGKFLKANVECCWSEFFYITCQSKHVPGSRPKKFQAIVSVFMDVPEVLECSRVT